MKKNNGQGFNFFTNPLSHGFKKFMYDLLGAQRYATHEETIEQLSHVILNEKNYENLGRLIAEVFEAGFVRSVEEQKEALGKLGLKVTLKTEPKSEGAPIFNQKNPSDFQ